MSPTLTPTQRRVLERMATHWARMCWNANESWWEMNAERMRTGTMARLERDGLIECVPGGWGAFHDSFRLSAAGRAALAGGQKGAKG